MKFVKEHYQRLKTDERGVALIFTLGILGLLMVLALGFASTAMTDRKSAANGSSLTCARMLAESAANRAMAILQYYDSGVNYSHYTSAMETDLYPSASFASNAGNYDYIWKLQTNGVLTWDSSFSSASNVNWHYIKVKDPMAPSTTYKIVGRVAYIIIPGFGIDPASVVETGKDEGAYVEPRPGVNVSEINLKSIDSTIDAGVAQAMSYDNVAGGKLPSSGTVTWQDFASLFYKIGITSNSAANMTMKSNFMDWFVVNSKADNESFWVDLNGDAAMNVKDLPATIKKIGEDSTHKFEMAHRFNLARADWDSLTVNDIVDSPTEWSLTPSTYDGKGILWIKNWQEKGTFSDAATRSKQIAANLIDYCDSNNEPTSDITPSNWTGTAPSYTGNEKTPYLNEFSFKVDGDVSVIPLVDPMGINPTTYTYVYTIKLVPSVETIDMYGGLSATTELVAAEGTFSCNLGGDGSTFSQDFSLTTSLALSVTSCDVGYRVVNDSVITLTTPSPSGQATSTGYFIRDVKIKVNKAVLSYNGNCDYSSTGTSAPFTMVDPLAMTPLMPPVTSYCSFIVDDPRQNLNPGDWTSVCNVSSDVRTLGKKNKKVSPAVNVLTLPLTTGDFDVELSTDPAATNNSSYSPSISTAYIRNATMQSPWELGFIHRGGNWQTLNIKEFNAESGVLGKGGAAYHDASSTGNGGDSNILDQVKMNSNVQNPMKFSLKIQKDKLLTALLTGVKSGVAPTSSTSWDPSSGGTNLTAAQISTMIGKIKAQNINFASRSAIAKVSELSTDAAFTNERQKREVIGKIINLCSVANTEYYTAIILAQSIKDIGGGVSISKDLLGNGVTSGSISVPNVDGPTSSRNITMPVGNCQFGQYDLGADEIVSEQKIKLELYKNSVTGKVDVLKYEYIDSN